MLVLQGWSASILFRDAKKINSSLQRYSPSNFSKQPSGSPWPLPEQLSMVPNTLPETTMNSDDLLGDDLLGKR